MIGEELADNGGTVCVVVVDAVEHELTSVDQNPVAQVGRQTRHDQLWYKAVKPEDIRPVSDIINTMKLPSRVRSFRDSLTSSR